MCLEGDTFVPPPLKTEKNSNIFPYSLNNSLYCTLYTKKHTRYLLFSWNDAFSSTVLLYYCTTSVNSTQVQNTAAPVTKFWN